jgi:hypothetical protein
MTALEKILLFRKMLPGPKGDKGDTGEQGIQGPKGDTGSKGDPGASGDEVIMINKTGGVSVKGTVVGQSATVDLAVEKIVINVPDPFGVIAEDGVADGDPVRVIKSGIADVLFIGSTTRKHLARGFITGDNGYVAGQALSEAVPTAPFASDKHFYEIGHVLESRVGAGLAKVMLHFN